MTITTVSEGKTLLSTDGSQVSKDVVTCKHTLLAPPTSPHSFTQVSYETLDMLARQLEYYFSNVNLSSDTYLQTLRNLNDGYVPASILSNFAKIQLLCPFDSYNAILKAATDHSENLEVVNIDKETSKTVVCAGPNTLLAIGPKDHNPIQLPKSSLTAHNSLSNIKSSNNDYSPDTILFREVPEDAVEEDFRQLFSECEIRPVIKEIVKDVSNYW
jgi:La domain